jgi:DNA-binding NtrC family response regulator
MAWTKRTLSTDHRSVFVIEDDLELSTIMDRILRSIDPEIHLSWATSVDEALAALSLATLQRHARPYDLIIADVFLEGERTGLDLWKFCHLEYPDVQWVLTSGSGFEGCLSSFGADNECPPFLHKPFSANEARQLFQDLLYPAQPGKERGISPRS